MYWFSVLKEDDDDGPYSIEKTPEKVKAALDKKNEFKNVSKLIKCICAIT